MIGITKKIVFLIILTFIVSLVGGFTVGQIYYQNKPAQKQQLPIQSISNPVLTDLSANISGVLVDKKELSSIEGDMDLPGIFGVFILENNGQKIEVYATDRVPTQFFQPPPENKALNKGHISFEDLKVGDTIEGGISVKNSSASDYIPIILGHSFTIYPSGEQQ